MSSITKKKLVCAKDLLKAIIEMGDGHGKHEEGIETMKWLIEQAKILEQVKEVQSRLDNGEIDGFDFGDEVYHILDGIY